MGTTEAKPEFPGTLQIATERQLLTAAAEVMRLIEALEDVQDLRSEIEDAERRQEERLERPSRVRDQALLEDRGIAEYDSGLSGVQLGESVNVFYRSICELQSHGGPHGMSPWPRQTLKRLLQIALE